MSLIRRLRRHLPPREGLLFGNLIETAGVFIGYFAEFLGGDAEKFTAFFGGKFNIVGSVCFSPMWYGCKIGAIGFDKDSIHGIGVQITKSFDDFNDFSCIFEGSNAIY